MELIRNHLRRLADFAGRENRQPFWLWVLCLYVAQMVPSMIVMFPLQMRLQTTLLPQMQAAQQSGAHVPPEQLFSLIVPLFSEMMALASVLNVIFLALIAAALVRRLHDGGRSGYWALPSFATGVVGHSFIWWMIADIPAMLHDPQSLGSFPIGWFVLVWTAGFVSSVVLLVLLVLPGTEGPNRYGDDPLAAYREARWRTHAMRVQPRPPAVVTRPHERRWDDPA